MSDSFYRLFRNLTVGIAGLASLATLVLMYKVTDFSHSAQDIAVLFYALLCVSPYAGAVHSVAYSSRQQESAFLTMLMTLMLALVALYAYYHSFIETPNDHSGFLFLFVPCMQWLVLIGLTRALRDSRPQGE